MQEYKCPVCGMIYDRETMKDACIESHEKVYISLTRRELFDLMQFIYSGCESELPESLLTKLGKYSRGYYV